VGDPRRDPEARAVGQREVDLEERADRQELVGAHEQPALRQVLALGDDAPVEALEGDPATSHDALVADLAVAGHGRRIRQVEGQPELATPGGGAQAG
jgi:hypothetical protein